MTHLASDVSDGMNDDLSNKCTDATEHLKTGLLRLSF